MQRLRPRLVPIGYLLNGIDVLNHEIAGLTDQSKVENPVKHRIAISAFIIILSMTISLVGLTNIIKYGYGYCGCLASQSSSFRS